MATKKVTTASNMGQLDQSSMPSWMKDLQAYQSPTITADAINIPETQAQSASEIVTSPLEASIAAAPSLERISQILSNINQQAYMSAPGRQEALGAIQQRVAGYVSPETIAQNQLAAAQTYGGRGFGVDSPAWQAAVSRALGLEREKLIGEGLGELQSFYQGMPTVDIQKYTMTPSEYASAQQSSLNAQLKAAELRQRAATETAQLGQTAALEKARLGQALQSELAREALDRARLAAEQEQQAAALAQRKWETEAAAYAKQNLDPYGREYGFDVSGQWVPGGRYHAGYYDSAGRFVARA